VSRPGRAALSSGHVRTVGEHGTPRLGVSGEAIVLGPAGDRLALRALRTAIRVAVAAVLIAAALYLALALTAVAVMGSGAQNAVVVRGAFPGGIAAQGDFAFVSSQPYDRSVMGKVEQAFVGVPGGSTVEVVAGPGATLTTAKGQILADELPTRFYGVPPQAKLGHEYLAVCVSGSGCTTGALILVPNDRLVGQVHRFISWHGLAGPKTYRR
jgi:hypothetical protein